MCVLMFTRRIRLRLSGRIRFDVLCCLIRLFATLVSLGHLISGLSAGPYGRICLLSNHGLSRITS